MGALEKDLGFLIEVYKEYKDSSGPPYEHLIKTEFRKISNYFIFDQNKENAIARIKRHLPNSDKYKFYATQAEQGIDDIYSLGIINNPGHNLIIHNL